MNITEPQRDSPLILVVDDDKFMRIQLRHAMEQAGYRVAEASDGEQALEVYTNIQPDIVLLDAMMPVMDGFTCCKVLRTLPRGEDIPVLIITALEDQESVDRAFEAGAIDYVTKPIHWAVLRQRVRRILEASRATAQLRQQTERAQLSEERLRLALEAAQMGTWDWDIPSGKVMYSTNTEIIQGPGVSSFESTLNSFLTSLHPEDRELVTEALRRTLEEGADYNIEFRIIWPDNTVHWVASKGQVYYDNTGKAVRMTGINMDMTERKQAEEAVQESEARLRLALEAAYTGIWDSDLLTDNVTWSDNFEQLFGLETGTFGRNYKAFLECVHPEDRKFIAQSLQRAIEEGAEHNVEFRVVWPDGSVRWMAGQGTVFYDETGKAVRMLGTTIDITQRKRVEEALRESEERWQLALRGNNDGIWDWNIKTNEVFFSIRWKEMLGYEDGDISNHVDEWTKRVHPDDLGGMKQLIQNHFAKKTPFYISEHRLLCKDGSYKWILDRGQALWDEEGNPVRMAGSNTDITERKRAEEELQRQNVRSQLFAEVTLKIRQSLHIQEILQTTVTEVQRIFQTDRVLIFQFGPNGIGKIVTEAVNPNWYSVLGQNITDDYFEFEYLRKYSQGRIYIVDDIEKAEIPACLVEFMREFHVKAKLAVPILMKAKLWGLLVAHQCANPRHWSSFEIELLGQLGDQIGIALAQAQLLEQETHQRQELARSNAELQQFASIASHDLQEPLRKIQAFGNRLKDKYHDVLSEQGRDYLERMHNAAQRMQILIDDLLVLSRVTTKAQPFVAVNLTQITQEVLSDLEVRIQQTGGHMEVGELPTIDADPIQMRQLLQNLISNALKFHRHEEPRVVKIYSQQMQSQDNHPTGGSQSTEQYQIIVEDNGIGFDEKYLDRIFNVFQRLHSRSDYEGTGMGLAICRKIAERHGGSITGESTLGQGAKFIVTLPIKQRKGENPE
jgi:PAS domain S-box-containing protein